MSRILYGSLAAARVLKRAANEALGRIPAGNQLTILPDDVFLVSYPRSGNTWMRFLLGNALHGEETDFRNVNRLVADIYQCSNKDLLILPRPRVLKSHEAYDHRYPKVIYILRDGRDVAVSYYHYHRAYGLYTGDFDAFITDFVAGQTGFGAWGGSALSWIENREQLPGGFLLLRYEDLVRDTDHELTRVLQFLGCERTEEETKHAIERGRIERMRAAESAARSSGRRPWKLRSEIKTVQRGGIGAWREAFSPYAKRVFTMSFGAVLRELGYEPSME